MSFLSRYRARGRTHCRGRRRLWLESLEERRLLAVVTVDTDQDVVEAADGLTSLREAVVTANTLPGADEIVFELGHDRPVTIRLEGGELELTDAVQITGPGPELLTIDAQHQSRIFNITATESDFVIEGLTLTAGRGVGIETENHWIDYSDYVGGAIRSDTEGLLTLRNSEISNSEVVEWGDGAAISAAGNVAIESSTISGNSRNSRTDQRTGTVLARGHVTLSFSTFTENSGGIYTDGDVTVVSSTISANGDGDDSLFGYPWPSTVESVGNVSVSSSTISRNSASGITAGGDVTVSSTTISENRGGYSAFEHPPWLVVGGINARGNVTITSSTISGNTEGGIKVRGNATIKSSTVTGNHRLSPDTTHGGAGVIFLHNLTLENSIVAANQGGDLNFLVRDPGDVYCDLPVRRDCPDAERTPEWNVRHSLVGDNTYTPLAEAPLGHPDSNGNLIGGPVGGAIDPRLGPLSDNGGPTHTHPLLTGSPAINMGDPSAVIGVDGLPRFDQRGEPYSRTVGGRIDMGAVESRPVGDSNGDGAFDALDLVMVLEAGKYEDDIANNATFEEGDWNGDGDFDSLDLVFALQAGHYVSQHSFN